MSGNDSIQNDTDSVNERRRSLLKLSAAGVLPSSVLGRVGSVEALRDDGIASRTLSSTTPYDGPFHRTYEATAISPDTVEFVTTAEDAVETGDAGEGEGEEGIREVPREAPEAGDKSASDPGPAQKSVPEASLVEADFDGLGAADGRGAVPSDNQVAVGENHIVNMINSRWAIFEKDGTQLFEVTLDDWWANVSPFIYEDEAAEDGTPSDFFDDYIIFDPRARYDPETGNFIMLCVEFSLNQGLGALLLSVSATDDPTGTWYNYRIPTISQQGDNPTPGLVDFPQLGYDGEAIYLTQNFFALPDFSFEEATMVGLDKRAAYAGDTIDANHFTDLRNADGSLAFTVQPAAVDGATPGHFVNSKFFQGEFLTVWTVADSFGADPTLTNDAITVKPYHNAPAAEQPDTEEKIDTLDDRIMRVSFDGEHVWTAHAVHDGRVRWYEIDPAGPSLVQSADFKRHGRPSFLPAIEADADGNAVFVYNTTNPRNDSNGFVHAEVAARTAATPTGEVGAFEVLQAGVDDYDYVDGEEGEDDEGAQVMRWGDYNGASIDPTDGSFWVTAQYTPTPADDTHPDEHLIDNDYATRIGKVVPK